METNLPERISDETAMELEMARETLEPIELSADDLDFAEMIDTGGGIEDPIDRAEEQKKFPAEPMEDAIVLPAEEELLQDTASYGEDTTPTLTDLFDEFLEIEEEAGLISESGELESDIVEQILQNEIASRMNWEIGAGEEGGAEQWKLQEAPASAKPVDNEQRDSHRLSFDELIELLSTEKAEEKHWPSATFAEGNGQDSEPDDADEQSTTAASDNPDRDRFFASALSYFLNEEYRQAIELCTALLARQGDDLQARALLGQAYFRTNAYRESAREFQRLLKIDPKNKEAHEKLGVIYANQGSFPRAIAHWEYLLQLAPDRRDIRESIQRAKQFINQTESP